MIRCLVVCSFLFQIEGFYFPGIAPVTYCEIDDGNCKSHIPIYVNRLVSQDSVIPYGYEAFDFCEPKEALSSPTENIGQVLFGNRIQNSPYQMKFLANEDCVKVCTKAYDQENDYLKFMKHGIRYSYENRWIIDNMPIAWCYETWSGDKFCSSGFPIGCYMDSGGRPQNACVISKQYQGKDKYYIFNHVDITIKYHRSKDGMGARLVQATLEPRSVADGNCKENSPLGIPAKFDKKVTIDYTYSVKFVEDRSIPWAARWDYILDSSPHHHRVLWFSIMNSILVMIFLTVFLCILAVRLRKHLARYKDMDETTLSRNSFAWSFAHGAIFRPPSHPMLLATLTGVGCQVIAMTFAILVFASLGFLSPASRGSLGTASLVSFVCFGGAAGYFSARLYKYIGGERWKTNMMMTTFLIPLTILIVAFAMDITFRCLGSSAAVPFSTWGVVLAGWLCVLAPLTCVGAYLGYKHQTVYTFDLYSNARKLLTSAPGNESTSDLLLIETKMKLPANEDVSHCRISFRASLFSAVSGGLLPFFSIFVLLNFIESALWSSQIFYQFGFCLVVAVLLVLATIESVLAICYYRIAAENYRWWWRSFLTSGFTAVYFFVYAIHFYFTKLSMEGIASAMLYFGYTTIMALLLFLFTGAIGFVSCLCFVTVIYGKMKDGRF